MDLGLNLMVGFRGIHLEEELGSLIRDFHIGGIVLFRRNIESPEQLRALLEGAQRCARQIMGRPLLVAVDQEGGPVQRLDALFTKLPSARELAAAGRDAVNQWAARAALELRRAGIHINLAPVLDVVSEESPNFMQERSLGSDPTSVADLGKLWIQALQEKGVSATAKHYPGLGLAQADPHHFAPVIRWPDQAARDRDIFPFLEAIRAGIHCVMTSHALYPSLDATWPATLSPTVNHEWLRQRLAFEGVLLSDDLDMAATSEKYTWKEMALQGLLSSIDFFLLCQTPGHIDLFHSALLDQIGRKAEIDA
jgi:beta-N-acetylhexosaminidase